MMGMCNVALHPLGGIVKVGRWSCRVLAILPRNCMSLLPLARPLFSHDPIFSETFFCA